MDNPFQIINDRLERIENLLEQVTQKLSIDSLSNGLPDKDEKPVTPKELAAYLGTSEQTLIRWRQKGKVPYMQLGSKILFMKSKVVAALEKQKGGRRYV